jgi:hypothetical protein
MSLLPCYLTLLIRIFTPAGDQGLFDFAIVSTGMLTDDAAAVAVAVAVAALPHGHRSASVRLPATKASLTLQSSAPGC